MKSENLEVRADWNGTTWTVRDLRDPRGPGIQVDALVMRSKRYGKGFCEGTIEALHGLDQEVAKHLSMADQRLLGVGAQLRSQRLLSRTNGAYKATLGQDGQISIA